MLPGKTFVHKRRLKAIAINIVFFMGFTSSRHSPNIVVGCDSTRSGWNSLSVAIMKEWEVSGQNYYGQSCSEVEKSIRIGNVAYSSQSPFREKAIALNEPLLNGCRNPMMKWGWLTGD